jgi:nucleoside-diphosphate-sugar epimerase
VTGGAGFIGSHTVDALLDHGSEVWVLDNLSTGSLHNLRAWKESHKFHFTRNTVTNYRTVEALAGKTDAIVHLAAVVSPYLSVRKPEIVNEVNVSGTLNILRAAVKKDVKRVVFASSSSVYGNQSALPISESNLPTPITPYGVSKLSGEKYCGAFCETYNLHTVALRYFNVYGQRQRANPYSGVIAIFASHLSKGERPRVYGDGEQTRDFVHVSDVVKANLRALQAKRAVGEAFNIGTGKGTSINRLFAILADLSDKSEIQPIYARERPGDIKHSYASITKSREILGFESKMELRQGLQRLIPPRSRINEFPRKS